MEVKPASHKNSKKLKSFNIGTEIVRFLLIFSSVTLTFYLSSLTIGSNLQLNSILASGLVGFLFCFVNKKYSPLVFCATFVGMSSTDVIPFNILNLILASVILQIVWEVLAPHFYGVGGKLGKTAMIASILVALLLTLFGTTDFLWYDSDSLDFENLLLALGFGILGAVGTKMVRNEADKVFHGNDAVFSSSLVGILSGTVVLLNSSFNPHALVIYAGSFAAMTANKRIKSTLPYIYIGALVGIIFILMEGVIPGIGGKLGFIGFISTQIYLLFKK